MEYRSPLGYNFKLDKSLSASKDETIKETPKKNESFNLDSSSSRRFSDFDNRRNSGGGRHYSPNWHRHSNSWKSPRNSQQDEVVPIENYYHPSMLEDPWEELEKNLEAS